MGNHEELMQIEGGKYAHLFRLQSEGYAEFNNGKQRPPPPPNPDVVGRNTSEAAPLLVQAPLK